MNKFLSQIDFKEEDNVYLIIDNKLNKKKSYKVHKIEYEEGGSFYDGYKVKINAYLQHENTDIIQKYMVAFFSSLNKIKSITAFNIKNFID